MRLTMIAALSLACTPLVACVTSEQLTSSEKQAVAYERASTAYARVRSMAMVALPLLPPVVALRVQVGLDAADAALVIANTDADPASRVAALRQLAGQVAYIIAELGTRSIR